MKILRNFIFFPVAAVLFAACTQENVADKIQLSDNAYSFSYEGNDSIVVKVYGASSWEVNADAEWLTAVKSDNEHFVVKAAKNETKEKRTAKVIVTSGSLSAEFRAEQFPLSFEGQINDLYGTMMAAAISRNGRYAASMMLEYTNPSTGEFVGTPFVIDLETGQVKEGLATTTDYNVIAAISDDGNTMVYGNVTDVKYAVFANDEKVELNLPASYTTATPQALSSDGSIIVGYATDASTGQFRPIRWVNGEPVVLEIPETDRFGRPLQTGAMARGCSADGEVVYGSEWKTMSAIYWVGEQMTHLADDFINPEDITFTTGNTMEGFICKLADYNGVSHNGKYFAASFVKKDEESVYNCFPAIVDIETGKITVFDDMEGSGMVADNNGLLFASTPGMSPVSCEVFNLQDLTSMSLQDYIKGKFDVTVPTNKIVYNVSEDGLTYGGMTAFETTPPYVDYVSFYLSFR